MDKIVCLNCGVISEESISEFEEMNVDLITKRFRPTLNEKVVFLKYCGVCERI